MIDTLDFDSVLARLAGQDLLEQALPAIDQAISNLARAGTLDVELDDLLVQLVQQGEETVAHALLRESAGWLSDARTDARALAEQWLRDGRPPNAPGYGEARRRAIETALLAPGTQPLGLGESGLDERVVEYPWIFARMAEIHPRGGRVLDAGSILNHREILERWNEAAFGPLSIVTLCHEGQAFLSEQVRYEFADLREIPYRDGWFDTVLCISTLEHVGMNNTIYGAGATCSSDPSSEATRALEEIRRVLAPGGTLLLSVPVGRAADRGWQRIFGVEDVWALCEGEHWQDARVRFFRSYADGWREAAPHEVGDAGYNDMHEGGIQNAPAWVAAAEAVALIELRKQGGEARTAERTTVRAIHPRYGYRFEYYADDRFVGGELAGGRYEPVESELFLSLLKLDSVVLDIGANLGHYSLLAAGQINASSGGRVYAFEPAGETFALLERNLAANPAAHVVQAFRMALSAEPGEIRIGLNDANQGDHRVFADSGTRWGARSECVPAVSVDQICAYPGMVPTIIKMDVQGHEYFVLRGMQDFLARRTPLAVLLEFSPSLNTYAGVDTRAQWELIEQSFERHLYIDPESGQLLPADFQSVLTECERHEHVNLLLINGDVL